MANNDRAFDSLLNRQPQSKPDREQSWAQLTSSYLQDLPQQLEAISTVLESKDYDTVKKQAHRIKGTSGTYRLDTISQSAAELERLAESRNPEAIVTAINKIMRLVQLEAKKLNSGAACSADNNERSTNG